MTAALVSMPTAMAMVAMTAPVTRTCIKPRPNTYLRIVNRRSSDSSNPIMNNRNTTPNSASVWALSVSPIRENPCGPIIMPAARYPRMALVLRRRKTGTTTTAASRKINTSIRSEGVCNGLPYFSNSKAALVFYFLNRAVRLNKLLTAMRLAKFEKRE